MEIFVQSFLNSGAKLAITVNPSTTIAQLKVLVWAAEGTTSTIQQLYFQNTLLANTATIATSSITTGTLIMSSNNIAEPLVWTKRQRQELKLDLAKLRRKAAGETTADYYRARNSYDIDQLPTVYAPGNNDTNDVVDNANTGGLVIGRPWVAD